MTLTAWYSLGHPVPEAGGRGARHRSGADYLLPEGEEPEEDQLASVVLQRVRDDAAAERVRVARRRDAPGEQEHLPLVEGVRRELKRCWRLWRDRRVQGQALEGAPKPTRYVFVILVARY